MLSIASLAALMSKISSFFRPHPGLTISIAVYYTRALSAKMNFNIDRMNMDLDIYPGRPDISMALESMTVLVATSSASSAEPPCGMLVGVCGPAGLTDSVINAVHKVDVAKHRWIGGIEVHVE